MIGVLGSIARSHVGGVRSRPLKRVKWIEVKEHESGHSMMCLDEANEIN